MSFPHNPTTTCVDLDFMQQVVDFAREKDVVVVHDNAYAEIGFDGYVPPSILQAEGAKEVAVELYSMTKSFSMAGWRVAFLVGNAEVVAALAKLKSYLDYGTFQPIQIAATVTLNEASGYPKVVNEIYQARRDALCGGLARIGWEIEPPKGTMFVWAPIPEPYREMGSVEFASYLVQRGAGGGVAGRGLRSRRRRPRAVRPHRERAAHRPGRPQPAQGPDRARRLRLAVPARRAADRPRLDGDVRPGQRWPRPAGAPAGPPGRSDRGVGDLLPRLPSSWMKRRARCVVTPRMAWASTRGSPSRISPHSMPSRTWRITSLTAVSWPLCSAGAKRSSVAAKATRLYSSRCSLDHRMDAAMPSSMRLTGSLIPSMAWRWVRRRSCCASRRISEKSSSLLEKYQ